MTDEQGSKAMSRTAIEPNYDYNLLAAEPGIDFIQWLINLKQRWKLILIITVLGTVLSVFASQISPKIFKVSVEVVLPAQYVITAVNTNGLYSFNSDKLFNLYYNKLRSKENFKNFIYEHGYLSRLYPDKQIAGVQTTSNVLDKLFSRFARTFVVETLEPKQLPREPKQSPTIFSVSLRHQDEALLVELLNHYLVYINDVLLLELSDFQKKDRDIQLSDYRQQIAILKSIAKNNIEFEITKRESDNKEKTALLKQQKQVIVDEAKLDRYIAIALRKEANKKQLNELKQQKQLMIDKAKQDRLSQIAVTQEALSIALSLDIVYPTRLEDMKVEQLNSTNAKTNITFSNEHSLPLYLMGSKYLTTLIKTLQDRETDIVFLKELNQIDSDINKVKNDQTLKSLITRENDAPYLTALNKINTEIELLTNDLGLKFLKERLQGDIHSEEFSEITNKIKQLESLSLNFTGLQVFILDKSAMLGNKPLTLARSLYVIFGAILSLFFALSIALISAVMANRKAGQD